MRCPDCGGLGVKQDCDRGVGGTVRSYICHDCGRRFKTLEKLVEDAGGAGVEPGECRLAALKPEADCDNCRGCGWSAAEIQRRKKLCRDGAFIRTPNGLISLQVGRKESKEVE